MTWGFRNGITLGIWTQKCPCNWRLNFFFQISQICLLKALAQKYGQIWGFLGSRTPPMGLYHLVRTTRMGKNQKKRKKKFDPPWCVTLPWFDPYTFFTQKRDSRLQSLRVQESLYTPKVSVWVGFYFTRSHYQTLSSTFIQLEIYFSC